MSLLSPPPLNMKKFGDGDRPGYGRRRSGVVGPWRRRLDRLKADGRSRRRERDKEEEKQLRPTGRLEIASGTVGRNLEAP